MERPESWVTKDEILRLTGATSRQLQRWHLEIFARLDEELVRRQGIGRGSIMLYHPDCVSMARRLLEMKEAGKRDFKEWRWQLWLDGYPISIREDCIDAIDTIQDAQMGMLSQKAEDALEVAETMIANIGTPKRGSLTEHIYGNIRHGPDRHSLLVWLMYAVLGQKPLVDWNSPVDSDEPLDLILDGHTKLEGDSEERPYPTIGELFARALGAPTGWAHTAPFPASVSIEMLRQPLEQATEDEWEQARDDWRPIVGGILSLERIDAVYRHWQQVKKDGSFSNDLNDVPPSDIQVLERMTKLVPFSVVTDLYHDPCVRALLTGLLMQIRRSNEVGDLETVLASLSTLAAHVGVNTPGRCA